ncbi:16S rRNA (uracil(1498)-N(3))-methyltransferase [Paramicrobacterium sp. CJ85]|uniref:16S rRNA (uracil(1498)-N(3))-methyltransferase n=1 Tax=Paramicrobacterium sp. CJ85 TaxID=3445355 RepID=UPI003F6162C5
MSTLFFDETLTPDAVDRTVTLRGAEAKHAISVVRVRVGERIMVGNGQGLLVEGTVSDIGNRELTIDVVSAESHAASSPAIVLVQALAKGDRDERAVQMCTELGATGIVPWQARRSVSRWEGLKRDKGVARWRTIAREASKQSIRPYVPTVSDLATTEQICDRAHRDRLLILDPTAKTRLSSIRLDSRDTLLVVGPEGGLAPDELSALVEAGGERVRLGETVLRTSSAGAAALAVLNVAAGTW